MKATVLLLALRLVVSALAQSQKILSTSSFAEPYCVAQPPPGSCYTAEVCNKGKLTPKPCDYYTVTYDKNGNRLEEKCEMDPKRPRCGKQANGLTCDPHNGWGSCCSEEGYCGSGAHFCKIKTKCETCPVDGGCQSGADCGPRPPVSPDNKCGAQNGGKLCDASINAGPCCSKEG
jgi:hypothetical protein